ncbi:MAG TPA: MarR family transcriptional regulator [Solirubrobacteraceae bacterium]|nr:MarR family transcriptional regulator [Solirubrobacteraceae bacterium]
MNAIAFGTKRAFHGFLKVTRKPLAAMGLTAARFDMLSALLDSRPEGWPELGMRQSALRRVLGVSAPVVTRMLQRLEALGLVTRERVRYGDRRQRVVNLTTAGERCIAEARRMILRAVRRLVFLAICFGCHRDARQRLVHMDTLEGYLRGIRAMAGDTARLCYPWGHPDD